MPSKWRPSFEPLEVRHLLSAVSSADLDDDDLTTELVQDEHLPWEALTTTQVVSAAAPVGQGFNLNAADLAFIVDQIKIAEAHAASATVSNPCGTLIGTDPFQIPAGPNAELLSLGLRTVDGTCNNLVPGQEDFGAADRPFPRLTAPHFRDAENLTFDPDGPGGQAIGDPTSYTQTTGAVQDSDPRIISNLIVDQTTSNPAAVAAAGPGAVPDPVTDALFIPNVAPDEGLSAPFNNTFVFFGQFFDHGLDLTTKSGGPVFMPLQSDDPLFVPGGPNFMLMSRAINDTGTPINKTTPFVDQQQTYASTASMQVFLREYENDASQEPVATGRLITTPVVGGMGTWTALKAQAADLLGIQLVDQDVFNVPLLATDPYGRFLRGPNGYPQIVLDDATLLEGDPSANGGLGVLVPANAVSTGHAFLDDIAHHAVPGTWDHDSNPATPGVPQTPDALAGTADDGLPGTYDDEMLGAHFVAGDGRVNENIGLTAVHHVFHGEHNRLVQHIKDVLLAGDPAVLVEWQISPGVWNGERVFQAARFVTEMEYQHLAFEEFARRIQPQINVFDAYDATIDAAITVEFSQAVYRFGHSMLAETLSRFNAPPGVNPNDIDLFDAFLNPPAFFDGGAAGTLTPDEGAGSLFRGLTTQVANEIDPFVTEAVRNSLVGLPLDLAAINIARGRDFGIPPLNQIRRELFAQTADPALKPYANWIELGLNLQVPESLVNYVAAYGTHPSITGATTLAGKRAAAGTLIAGITPDSIDFMNGLGIYANVGGVTTTGVDDIDLWVGGLGEKRQPFGGLLGETMNHIFELQMENLQDGDRFYYLLRTAGMNLLVQLEGNSFSELIERNTTASNLPGDVFARPDFFFDAAVQGSVPLTPIVDDPNTPYDETLLLVRETDGTIRFTGGEHTNWAGDDSALPGEGDRIRSGDGDDTIRGNGGDDRLEGGAGNDNIIGGLGNDILTDIFGDDDIKGGDGNDAISSGQGFDLLQGGRGSDFIIGATDPKEILGGPGNDFILDGDSTGDNHGDDGDDWIEGGLQGDAMEGDSGLPILLGTDVNTPGHDVLNGNEGDDRYFGEGGDDILISGTGIERFLGQFGHDWVTHYNDPQPGDSDLLNDVFAVPPPVIVDFDTFNGVEGLSGWHLDDVLRGDHLGALDLVDHELDAAGIARINGLAALLPSGATSFTGGNIIIGGRGSDILEGRGGDDIIDGDAWLRAQLLAPDPAGPPGATQLVDSMVALLTDVFAGLIDPGDISIVRTIETGSGPGIDTAVFTGPFADYDISFDGEAFTIVHARGDGLSADPALNNGTDRVRNVELLQFADQTIAVANPLYFSTVGNVAVPGVGGTPDDADVYQWIGFGANFQRIVDASVEGLAGAADIDGLSVVADDHFFASFIDGTTVPGVGTVADEDVVEFNAGVWTQFFDGSAQGLGGVGGLDLDAISVDGTTLYFSTLGNVAVPGVGGTADDADVYSWNGTSFAREWDATAMGLAGAANVDGLSVVGPDHFFLSFTSVTTTVPGLGAVENEDVVEYNAGTWSLYFDGTDKGLTDSGLNLDAISVKADSVPGVTISESSGSTDVAEGGTTDTYTVVLNTAPTSTVFITVAPDGQINTATPTAPLMFDGTNWSIPQQVTVTAVDDSDVEGNHTGTITHTASSSDPNYDSISIDPVTANISDNDVEIFQGDGFEAGLGAWQTTGDVSTQGSGFGETPAEGSQQAVLTNADAQGGNVADSTLESFLGVSGGALDALGNGDATAGSAMKRSIGVVAGTVLSVQYNFLTNEATPEATFNDFSFFSVVGVGVDTVIELADTGASGFGPSASTYNESTGYGTFTFTFTAAGTYTIGFGVIDVQDTVFDSALLIDQITVGTVGNAPPQLDPIGNKSVNVGSTLSFTATATDPDLADTLSFSLDAASIAAGMTIGANTGQFNWSPSAAQSPGVFPVTVTVTDDGSPTLSDFETFIITVGGGGLEDGFEAGLGAWQTTGDVSTQGSGFGETPAEGSQQAVLTNADAQGGDVADSTLESFLGVSGGALDALGNGDATAGSAMKQSVTVAAGSVLDVQYNFLTNEATPEATFNDFSFFSVVGVGVNTVIELADTGASGFGPSASTYSESTGYGTFTFTFTAAGTYTIGFGVVDVEDTIFDSALLLDLLSISDGAAAPAQVFDEQATSVTGRHLFYNNSGFDGNTPGVSPSDAAAIATDKSAYRPGAGTIAPASMSSYSRGLNGVFVDLTGAHGTLSLGDFGFKISNQGAGANGTPSTWVSAPAPIAFTVLSDTPAVGTDRVEFIWADNAIENRYLEVSVLGDDAAGSNNTNTGLAATDVFYFGNIIGDTFVDTPSTVFLTTSADESQIANQIISAATITSNWDMDRNGVHLASDRIVAYNNTITALNRITIGDPRTTSAPRDIVGGSSAVASALTIPDAPSQPNTASLAPARPAKAEQEGSVVAELSRLLEGPDGLRALVLAEAVDDVALESKFDEPLLELLAHERP